MSVLTPAWAQEIVADGFVEFADGHLSAAASFALTLELGTVDEVRTITLGTTRGSVGLGGLGKLVVDLQTAIDLGTRFTHGAGQTHIESQWAISRQAQLLSY